VTHEGEETNDMQPPAEFDRSPVETSRSPAEFSAGRRRGLVRGDTGGDEGGREGGGEEEERSPARKRWIQSVTSVREGEWVAPKEVAYDEAHSGVHRQGGGMEMKSCDCRQREV
jgi:hypothetical protein